MTRPGQIALTRMLSRPYETAAPRVSPRTAALLAWYGIDPAMPTTAATEATLTIDPPPLRTMPGITVRMPRNTPRWFTAVTLAHSSSSASMPTERTWIPALLTSTSIGPWVRSTVATSSRHAPGSVTSWP